MTHLLRGVYGAGLFAAAVTLGAGLWGVIDHGSPASATAWVAGALRAADVLLLVLVPFWGVMALALAAVAVCGTWAIRSAGTAPMREQMHRTVSTGWLGLLLSLGIFMAFGMALWAVLDNPLRGMAFVFDYQPIRFGEKSVPLAADLFLSSRFQSATVMFAFIAICVGLLVIMLILVLLPSIAVELRLVRGDVPQRLKAWLSRGYSLFDWTIAGWAYLFVLVIWLGAALTLVLVGFRVRGSEFPYDLTCAYLTLQGWSGKGLSWVVFPVVGATTGLIAIGGVALKQLQALRVPLDIALDVDNHFREFPRRAMPRVRIFERYIAELEMVLARGYRRIVIVAHSQGTVITADLLRYLQQRLKLEPTTQTDRLAQLGLALENADVSLLTVGCPLRQLYARRFPDLYHWVVADLGDGTTGPDHTELGIKCWLNRWGAADYVGRWLWEHSGAPIDTDKCTGADAHTHYFEENQTMVVAALRSLIWGALPLIPDLTVSTRATEQVCGRVSFDRLRPIASSESAPIGVLATV